MINRLCCVSEPRSHRSEKRGPTTPQEHLDLGVNYFLFQLRSPKAVGRSSIHKKWNVVMEGHWEPKIRLQRWFPLSVLLAALQDHTPFLGFNIKTKTEPKFPHQLLSSAQPFPGAADALWIPGQLSWEQPGQLQSIVLFGLWLWNRCSVQPVGGDSGAIITTLITLARFLLGEPHGITVPLPDLGFW